MISDERSKQAYERLEIPKIYHPFITGAYNEKIRALTDGTGVKVNIPPLSVQKDEISVAGEREGVLKVKHAILQVGYCNQSSFRIFQATFLMVDIGSRHTTR